MNKSNMSLTELKKQEENDHKNIKLKLSKSCTVP